MPDTADMCQEELDQWSDVVNNELMGGAKINNDLFWRLHTDDSTRIIAGKINNEIVTLVPFG